MSSRASIDVFAYRAIGDIDENIYGQFLSRRRWVSDEGLYDPGHPDSGGDGIRRAVRDAIARSAPPVIRWPGGCTGTTYRWEDGIGPVADRLPSVDWHFGYDVGNGFGTAEFIAFCRGIGAEPHINLPLGSESMRDALNWVEYVNGHGQSKWVRLRRAHGYEQPWNVRYWQIGNEEWGEWEIGHRGAEDYAAHAREWGKAIKRIGSDIRILGLGAWRPEDAVDWSCTVLREAWEQLDYLTLHTYWPFDPGSPDGDYDRIAAVGPGDERTMIALGGLIDLVAREKTGNHRPALAFTEWNATDTTQRELSPAWRPGRAQYRLVDAMACAAFLNAMQRQCRIVKLANFSQPINVVGALVVTPDAVIREPVYWALTLQRQHSGNIAVPVHVDCDGFGDSDAPLLDVSATRSANPDRLWLSVVNRSRTEEVVASIRVPDCSPRPSARMWELWHENPLAGNSVDRPDEVAPRESTVPVGTTFELALRPHSYQIVEVSL